ncbi:hypothetical protein V2J09_023993 [Rumex salicifolius]
MDKQVGLFGLANAVLSRVSACAADRIRLASNVKKELKKLENLLSAVCIVLQDAEQKQVTDSMIREWLRDLKNVVYDIDDLVDDVVTEALQHGMNEDDIIKQVSYYMSPSAQISHFMLSKKLEHILKRLDELEAVKRDFQLIEDQLDVLVSEDNQTRMLTYVENRDIVGREVDTRRIIDCLSKITKSKDLCVIPIVGSKGLGKTSFGKLVFGDKWVGQNYDIQLWMRVSNQFDLRKVIEDIVESATGISVLNLEMERLHRKLFNLLYGKKYLLFLDDLHVEDVKEWVEFKRMLSIGKPGSAILLTTCTSSVGLMTGTVAPYSLGKLSDEKCWLIFKQYAFRQGEENRHPRLVEIGMSIAKKCGGLPLAAKTLGSILFGVRDEIEWLRIEKNNLLSEESADIVATLRLSFDLIPPHLKPCFAYCSIFAKDHNVYRELLISHWMAQGLLQSGHGEELEEVGNRFFGALQSRSFFQDEHVIHSESVVSCGMHDLIHDMAHDVAGDEIVVMNCDKRIKFAEQIRHIVWDRDDLSSQKFPRHLCKAKKVRSFIFNHSMGPVNTSFLEALIAAFKFLRVLDLHNSEFDKLPNSVGKLSHLRLLNLSRNQRIKSLPSSICNLLNLQTLYILACHQLEELPSKGIKKLARLRHLHVTLSKQAHFLPNKGLHALTSLQTLQLYKCTELMTLSEGIRNLISLKSLLIYGCPVLSFLPNGMKHLTKLERLAIRNCAKLDLMLGEGLAGLFSLQSLELGGIPKTIAFPESIRSASASLQYLYIEDCSGLIRLPNWLQHFTSLLKVFILQCPKFCVLPRGILGLSALKTLSIKGCPYMRARCARNQGKDWPLISHIPEIDLDD